MTNYSVGPDGTTYNLGNSNVNSVPNTPISESDTSRVLGRQISAGNIRGNQNITGIFTVLNTANSKPIVTIDGTNDYILIADPTTGLNRIIIGLLPDGTYGMAISKTGKDVIKDGFA